VGAELVETIIALEVLMEVLMQAVSVLEEARLLLDDIAAVDEDEDEDEDVAAEEKLDTDELVTDKLRTEELETDTLEEIKTEVDDELCELGLVGESTRLLDQAAPLQSPNPS
jgi:hypothetical protein